MKKSLEWSRRKLDHERKGMEWEEVPRRKACANWFCQWSLRKKRRSRPNPRPKVRKSIVVDAGLTVNELTRLLKDP